MIRALRSFWSAAKDELHQVADRRRVVALGLLERLEAEGCGTTTMAASVRLDLAVADLIDGFSGRSSEPS